MAIETHSDLDQKPPFIGDVLDEIHWRQWDEAHPQIEPPQTRSEVKAGLTRQEADDIKRAGRLVMRVLESGAYQDQVVPVDSILSRGRTSPLAISIAQERLLAHGIITEQTKMASPANTGYEVQQYEDYSPDLDALHITGIDEDKVDRPAKHRK